MANSDRIRVGVPVPRAGTTSRIEWSPYFGTFFAIREAGGIEGQQLVAVRNDPDCIPKPYRSLGERVVREDSFHVIFGFGMASTRVAVMPVVEKWHVC